MVVSMSKKKLVVRSPVLSYVDTKNGIKAHYAHDGDPIICSDVVRWMLSDTPKRIRLVASEQPLETDVWQKIWLHKQGKWCCRRVDSHLERILDPLTLMIHQNFPALADSESTLYFSIEVAR